jgi:hypothetical protein
MTVLEECTIEEQRPVMRFLWAKGLKAKDIHKEMFPLYGGSQLGGKHFLMTKSLKRRCQVAETAIKRLLFCRFLRNGKAMGQVYECW